MARLGVAYRSPRTPARKIFRDALLNFALGALLPGLSRRIAWVARASPRRITVYILATTAFSLGIDWIIRAAGRGAVERHALETRLRKELGRPPWPEELERALMEEHGLSDPLR